MTEKAGRLRCTRCNRIIKNGRVEIIHDQPYGENCAKITRRMEISLDESELISTFNNAGSEVSNQS